MGIFPPWYCICSDVWSHVGCLHPAHRDYFKRPKDYLDWYEKYGPLRNNLAAPTVAILLYRKHVITKQPYIPELITVMEEQGIRPVPIFINGIEAHTVVSAFCLSFKTLYFCRLAWWRPILISQLDKECRVPVHTAANARQKVLISKSDIQDHVCSTFSWPTLWCHINLLFSAGLIGWCYRTCPGICVSHARFIRNSWCISWILITRQLHLVPFYNICSCSSGKMSLWFILLQPPLSKAYTS